MIENRSRAAKRRFLSLSERRKVSQAVKSSKKYQEAISQPGYQERRLERVNSLESRAKRSEAIKGRIHIHRGTEGKMIDPAQLPEYEALGWVRVV